MLSLIRSLFFLLVEWATRPLRYGVAVLFFAVIVVAVFVKGDQSE